MFSNSCVRVSIPIEHVTNSVNSLVEYLRGIQYQGLFGAEFKRDPRDGQLKLLEINARSMGGNLFATYCGINDILTAYHDALGKPVTPTMKDKYGVYGISLLKDIPALTQRVLRSQFSSHDLIPYLQKKYWSRFSFDDPIPLFKGVH